MSKPLTIKKVELFVYGDLTMARRKWGLHEPCDFVHNVCRITTEDGYVGIGATYGMNYDCADVVTFEAAKVYMNGLIGKSALDRESIWSWMKSRANVATNTTVAMYDIALWDLTAKYANLPLYQMLGACRDRIPAYASTDTYNTDEEYVTWVGKAIKKGYKFIKMHCYCKIEDDLRLVKLIQEKFGYEKTGVKFCLDSDLSYNREGSYRMAKLLEEYDWFWLESPMNDYDLEGYKQLVEKTNIPISCGGNCMLSLAEIATGIRYGAWTDVRADATVNGGITPMRKIMHLAEANSMRCEIQSWGDTIAMAANLHVMLSHGNCTYFEHAFPHECHDLAAVKPFDIDNEGYINAPEGPGLGVDLDWDVVEKYKIRYACKE